MLISYQPVHTHTIHILGSFLIQFSSSLNKSVKQFLQFNTLQKQFHLHWDLSITTKTKIQISVKLAGHHLFFLKKLCIDIMLEKF